MNLETHYQKLEQMYFDISDVVDSSQKLIDFLEEMDAYHVQINLLKNHVEFSKKHLKNIAYEMDVTDQAINFNKSMKGTRP